MKKVILKKIKITYKPACTLDNDTRIVLVNDHVESKIAAFRIARTVFEELTWEQKKEGQVFFSITGKRSEVKADWKQLPNTHFGVFLASEWPSGFKLGPHEV